VLNAGQGRSTAAQICRRCPGRSCDSTAGHIGSCTKKLGLVASCSCSNHVEAEAHCRPGSICCCTCWAYTSSARGRNRGHAKVRRDAGNITAQAPWMVHQCYYCLGSCWQHHSQHTLSMLCLLSALVHLVCSNCTVLECLPDSHSMPCYVSGSPRSLSSRLRRNSWLQQAQLVGPRLWFMQQSVCLSGLQA
jgi:hypothetical protein